MANHRSSEKRIRSNKTKRTLNRYQGRTVRNAVKKVRESENPETPTQDLSKVISQVDKLAKKNVIHKNKAANLKSKLMRKANVKAAAPAQ
ncbi:MAG TPA: 30S ribosomal protein S20 [Bacteroidales bacterium]|nr:30S ribosomal protein S20 [Bacteroidales bacterium]HPS61918.1 30S ribosomal protein S20 [Bacteroidales bacterium]